MAGNPGISSENNLSKFSEIFISAPEAGIQGLEAQLKDFKTHIESIRGESKNVPNIERPFLRHF